MQQRTCEAMRMRVTALERELTECSRRVSSEREQRKLDSERMGSAAKAAVNEASQRCTLASRSLPSTCACSHVEA